MRVSGGVFGADACVVGKVFMDCNGDRMQQSGEPGVPRVRLWLETGVSITTDASGRYSFCGLSPRSHAVRIDPATLPSGDRLVVTSNRNLGAAGSLFLDAKAGELVRGDFALAGCAVSTAAPAPVSSSPPQIRFESPDEGSEAPHE